MCRTLVAAALLHLAVPCVAVAAAPEPDEEQGPRFDIAEIRVLGNTLLPAIEIERAAYPHTGPDRSMRDVETARADVEAAYRAAGFGTVLVDIPEQDVGDGVVRLRVTEGRLDKVRVTGTRYYSNRRILAQLPALRPGEAPHLPSVQEQLAALNSQTPDRAVVPVLKSGSRPGTVDVELKVSDQLPVHGSLELNDRYTADTSRLRLNASIGYGNLFQRNDSINLQYQFAPEKPEQVQAWIGSYAFRLRAVPSMSFAVYGVDSSTDVAALGTLSVIGNGRILGARAVRQLPAPGGWNHSLTFGLDYKDFLENIVLSEEDSLVTPIEYLNWSVGWTAGRRSEASQIGLTATANAGIRGLGNSVGEFADKRFRGVPNYVYLRTGVQYQRRLAPSWSLFGRATLQYASDPLVSNEQFGVGGADTVRGYLESSVLGDHGATGGIELRYGGMARRLSLSPDRLYLFGFFDAGAVRLRIPLPQQTRTTGISSAGVGLRLLDWHGMDLAVDAARALDAVGDTGAGDVRAHFTLSYGF